LGPKFALSGRAGEFGRFGVVLETAAFRSHRTLELRRRAAQRRQNQSFQNRLNCTRRRLFGETDLQLHSIVMGRDPNDLASPYRNGLGKAKNTVRPMDIVPPCDWLVAIGRFGIELELDPLGDTEA